MEVVAAFESRITSGPLHSLKLPKGLSIGGIIGAEGVTIAGGDSVVEPGDTVIVLNLSASRPAVEKLFVRRLL